MPNQPFGLALNGLALPAPETFKRPLGWSNRKRPRFDRQVALTRFFPGRRAASLKGLIALSYQPARPDEDARVDEDRFNELVNEAVDGLPEEFATRLENVDVVVAAAPSEQTLREMGLAGRGTLLGLYRGVPQTRRTSRYGNVPPDQIVIYREPILAKARAECAGGDLDGTVRAMVGRTVLHEIGHHFGLSEADLRRIDYG